MSQEGEHNENKQFSFTELHLTLQGGESGTSKGAVKRVPQLLPTTSKVAKKSPLATDDGSVRSSQEADLRVKAKGLLNQWCNTAK